MGAFTLIPVTRVPEPLTLARNASRWLVELQAVQANPKATKSQVEKAQNKYGHSEIKQALEKMFHGKCAYCESKITVVAYGEIEHFYPKSLYPEHTFNWTNLLYSCSICNNARHKGSKFPVDLEGNPLLIDPTDGVTDPNHHLDFVWDDIAQIASIYGRNLRGEEVVNTFDLNGMRGRKELINYRSQKVKKLIILLKMAQKGNPEAMSLLKEACQVDAEYIAFARIYIAPYIE